MKVPVYSFFHGDFVDVDFFASLFYIHKEGPEEFLHTEAMACERAFMNPIHGT